MSTSLHQHYHTLVQCFSTGLQLVFGAKQFIAKWDYLHVLELLESLRHLILQPSHYDNQKHLQFQTAQRKEA